jgi:hypothetical protein
LTKQKKSLLIAGILFIAVGFIVYWFYPSKANSFLSDEEMMNEINPHFSNVKISEVQDKVFLDDNHVFVPYITTEGDYAISYWVYEKHQWTNEYTGTMGSPLHVRIDSSQSYFLWNFNPEDKLNILDFYLIKDRNFHVSDGVQSYEPRIQINLPVQVSKEQYSYSAMKVPEEWTQLISEHEQLIKAQLPDPFFGDMFIPPSLHFGWIAYDEKGKITYPGPDSGSGYGGGNLSEIVHYLDPMLLEVGNK